MAGEILVLIPSSGGTAFIRFLCDSVWDAYRMRVRLVAIHLREVSGERMKIRTSETLTSVPLGGTTFCALVSPDDSELGHG